MVAESDVSTMGAKVVPRLVGFVLRMEVESDVLLKAVQAVRSEWDCAKLTVEVENVR